MKKFFAISLSLLLVFCIMPTAFAATGEIKHTGTAPTIDGKLDAVWETANVYQMENYIVAVHDNANLDPKKDASDLSGEWRALWDENYFYLFVDITDPVRIRVNADRGQNVNYDDSIQVFVQPNAETAYTSGLFHIDNAKGDFWHGPPNWAALKDADAVQYAINDYGDGYILEMAVPWDQVGEGGTKPAAGASLLLDVQAVDNDLGDERSEIGTEGRYPQSKLTWSDLDNKAYEDASHMGTIVLGGPEQAEGNDETPVQAGEGSNSGGDASANPTTPQMPKTGMGGAADNAAPWIIVALAGAAALFVSIRKIRSRV